MQGKEGEQESTYSPNSILPPHTRYVTVLILLILKEKALISFKKL